MNGMYQQLFDIQSWMTDFFYFYESLRESQSQSSVLIAVKKQIVALIKTLTWANVNYKTPKLEIIYIIRRSMDAFNVKERETVT